MAGGEKLGCLSSWGFVQNNFWGLKLEDRFFCFNTLGVWTIVVVNKKT